MEIEVMSSENLKLYESAGSPNSRRVRIFLAEKRISVARVAVDLGAKEQFSDAYSRINPRRVVPTLVLADGTAIGEVPAIFRYLEETHPASPLFGTSPKDRALVTMWERRMELEGFAAVKQFATPLPDSRVAQSPERTTMSRFRRSSNADGSG
jgi:glutathione S-transferase